MFKRLGINMPTSGVITADQRQQVLAIAGGTENEDLPAYVVMPTF